MDIMASNGYAQFNLSKLRTSTGVLSRRRDSHSSKGDSGYDSDLEASSPPLDFVNFDQDIHYATLPSVPEVPLINRSLLRTRYSGLIKPSSHHHSTITSCPTSVAPAAQRYLLDFKASSARNRKISSHYPAEIVKATNLTSQNEDIERWIKDNLPSRNRPQERVSSITSLSSTSSCEMYSTTDDVSEEELEDSNVGQQSSNPLATLKIIKLILRKMEVNLRYAAYRQCTRGNDNSRTSSRSTITSQDSGRNGSQRPGQKRKLEGSPPPDDEDGEGDGSSKRRRGSATATDSSDTGARFACPFYKHDPDRYRNRRTCPGPGWPTVHRMKEHLYRSHAQPIFCPICYSTFKSDKEQSNHIRLQQCQRSGPQQIEGIDRETVWILRKRTTALRLEEDKWRDVYHVLFPEVPTPDIPSPFYDCDSPSEASRRFRRELLRRVQEELLSTAGQTSGPVEQQLLRQVADIIRRCETELLQPSVQGPALLPSSSVDGFASSERRTSYRSTTSAESSLVSSSYHHHHLNPTSHSFSPLRQDSCTSNNLQVPQQHLYGPPAAVNEPAINFGPVDWEPTYSGAFGEGLDWDVIFPSLAPDVSVGGGAGHGEPFASAAGAMSAPMYT